MLLKEQDGTVYSRDYENNFSPKINYSAIAITDRFTPLVGIDIRFKNDLSISTEYCQAKDIRLSLHNSQLALQEERTFLVGIAYRKHNIKLPFGWYEDRKWRNDVNFKLDIAINDRKTFVFRPENYSAEVSAGNKSITINPTLDYTINRYYTIRVFYNSNIVSPYTTQGYSTSYTYFGINLSLQFH